MKNKENFSPFWFSKATINLFNLIIRCFAFPLDETYVEGERVVFFSVLLFASPTGWRNFFLVANWRYCVVHETISDRPRRTWREIEI